jgi:hypothetical protein
MTFTLKPVELSASAKSRTDKLKLKAPEQKLVDELGQWEPGMLGLGPRLWDSEHFEAMLRRWWITEQAAWSRYGAPEVLIKIHVLREAS